MCGRYSLNERALLRAARHLKIDNIPHVESRYNIAPTTTNPVILNRGGAPVVELLRWGLIPSWAKDTKSGASMINARCETVDTKPAFRSAFKGWRCLVVTDGFYEWRQDRQPKQPCRYYLPNDEPMVMAGLWERWQDPATSQPILSYAIVTTDANPAVAEVHDRMPVVLEPEKWELWLSADTPAPALSELLRPWPHELLMKEVTPRMNKVTFQGPDCHEPDCPPQTELPLNSA
jgi:putative SOS response-associated peptidase YedK